MRFRADSLAIVGVLLVTACVTYRPQPIDPGAVSAEISQRELDPQVVQEELARIAPQAHWNGVTWDRLSLFAEALHFNPRIAEARSAARSAAASARAARVGPAWTLTLTGEYTRHAIESSPWLYGATSDVPLDLGERRSARIESSNLAAEIARYDYLEAVWSVRISLQRTLAERLLASHEVEVSATLTQIRVRQLAAVERRVFAGEAARAEMERVRADAAADARRLSDSQARLAQANGALAEALGVPASALANATLEWVGFETPNPDETALAERIKLDALLSRADVLRAVAAYDQSESMLQGEVARQFPAIHIGPGYTWERGLVKLPFTLGLVLPPLDLNQHAIAAAEARRAEAGHHLESVVAADQAAIDAAIVESAAARTALSRIRADELPTARSFAREADTAMDQGAIDRVDWAAAQAGEQLAELAEIDALRRVHAAEASLEDALRRPLEGPELRLASLHGDKQ